jgi:hypothetical protein
MRRSFFGSEARQVKWKRKSLHFEVKQVVFFSLVRMEEKQSKSRGKRKSNESKQRETSKGSVADPGCLSRIPDLDFY